MQEINRLNEVPVSITICDTEGIIIEMNEKSAATFAKNGGRQLIGKSLKDCHKAKDNEKILEMIKSGSVNIYTIEKDGKKKMIYQCPWMEGGKIGGLVELSFEIPEQIPHFVRESKIIFHVTSADRWNKAQSTGTYLPEAYEQDGFIHCCKKDQLVGVGERYYKGQSGLIILTINPDKMTSKVVYENLIGGEELYPHIYGPLPVEAVGSLAEFSENADGKFEFPKKWKTLGK